MPKVSNCGQNVPCGSSSSSLVNSQSCGKDKCQTQTLIDAQADLTTSNSLNGFLTQNQSIILRLNTESQSFLTLLVGGSLTFPLTEPELATINASFALLQQDVSLLNNTAGQVTTNIQSLIAQDKVVTCDLTSCGLTNSCKNVSIPFVQPCGEIKERHRKSKKGKSFGRSYGNGLSYF